MLSRIAESLYWLGRYVERAEGTARILDVHYHLLLEDRWVDESAACVALLEVMGLEDRVVPDCDSSVVTRLLAFDAEYTEQGPRRLVGVDARVFEQLVHSDVENACGVVGALDITTYPIERFCVARQHHSITALLLLLLALLRARRRTLHL